MPGLGSAVGILRLGVGLLAVSPVVVVQPQLVGHASSSSLRTGASAVGTPFTFTHRLTHPSTSGNAILVCVQSANNVTVTVTDDASNSYSVGVAANDAGDSTHLSILGAFAVASGATTLTVTFSAAPGDWVQVASTELTNVTGFDGSGATASGNSTSPSAGLTTSAPDIAYCVVSTVHNAQSGFTAGTGGTLLSACRLDGFAVQYGSSAMTLATSGHWFAAAVNLKRGSAGSVPSGIRVIHRYAVNLPVSAAAGGNGTSFTSPQTLQFPCSGSSLACLAGGSLNGVPSTAFTDSNSNTWVLNTSNNSGGGVSNAEVHSLNATTSANMTVTITWQDNTKDSTAIFYDIAGVTALDQTILQTGSNFGGGPSLTAFTPGAAPAIALIGVAWGTDTSSGLSPGLTDAAFYSGISHDGPSPCDENNGWGHYLIPNTSAVTFTFSVAFSGGVGAFSAAGVVLK